MLKFVNKLSDDSNLDIETEYMFDLKIYYKSKKRTMMNRALILHLTTILSSFLFLSIDSNANESSKKKTPQINEPAKSDDNKSTAIYIEADAVTNSNKIINASGSVEMRHKSRTIYADNIYYNIDDKVVTAKGNTKTINDDGTMQFADIITYDEVTEEGFGENIASLSKDNTRIYARKFERIDKDTNRLLNVVYTPCEICKDDKNQSPTWSIRASKITQDKKRKLVHFNNAVILLKDAPVFYIPYFWTPDPEIEQASGFLTPKVGSTEGRGLSYEQPYLLALSKHDELLISPQFNTKVSPLLNFSYTRNFFSGLFTLRGGYTKESYFDTIGNRIDDFNLVNPKARRDERFYFLSDGNFKLNKTWSYNFAIQTLKDSFLEETNSNFFDRYEIEEAFVQKGDLKIDNRFLVNQFNLKNISSNVYFNLSLADFQNLQTGRFDNLPSGAARPVSLDYRTYPQITPMIEAMWSPKSPLIGGKLTTYFSGIALKYKNSSILDLTPEIVDPNESYNTTRMTGRLDWENVSYSKHGLRNEFYVSLRNDFYQLSNLNSSNDKKSTSRNLNSFSYSLSYPLYNSFKDTRIIVEPISQYIVSSNVKKDQLIGKQDSPINDFEASQLFSYNRSSGFDRFESGERINLGLKTQLINTNGYSHSILFGRTYRSKVLTDFTRTLASNITYDNYGFADTSSDYVVDYSITSKFGYGYYRSRLDSNSFRAKTGEAGYSINTKDTSVTLRYIYDNVLDNPIINSGKITTVFASKDIYKRSPDSFGVYKNAQIYGSHFFDKNWGVTARLDRDLLLNKFRRSNISLIYRDDCSWYELAYQRDDTRINTVGGKPRTSWQFRVNLATLGTTKSANRFTR